MVDTVVIVATGMTPMDSAVALVQAYLRVNGYFTVTEYPVIASGKGGTYRTATDLDVLAVRFPHSGHIVPGRTEGRDEGLRGFPDRCRAASGPTGATATVVPVR